MIFAYITVFSSFEIRVVEAGNSLFLQFCHALDLNITLILLLRHFLTLNVSSSKQRKGNNIYKLTRPWISHS